MVAGVVLDPGDAIFEAIHDLHAGDRIEIFGAPVFFAGGLEPVVDGNRFRIAAQFAVCRHGVGDLGHDLVGDGAVDHDALGRPADAGAAQLGVADDLHGLVDVCRGMDIGVAVTVEVEESGHARLVADQFDETAASARDDEVDEFIGLEQGGHRSAVGRLNGLDGILR